MNIPIKLQISEAHKTIYLHLYFPRFKCPPTYIYIYGFKCVNFDGFEVGARRREPSKLMIPE